MYHKPILPSAANTVLLHKPAVYLLYHDMAQMRKLW